MPAAEFKFKMGVLIYCNCVRCTIMPLAGLYHQKVLIILSAIVSEFVISEEQRMENI
jgi:hypothetical protein